MRSDYAELMEQLKELGLNSWGNKNAYITFSHSGGSTHIGPVAEFFKRATNLAEKAAEALAAKEAECEELKKQLSKAHSRQSYREEYFCAAIKREAKEAECEALRVEVERWAEQANKEDECRQMWQAKAEAAEAKLKRIIKWLEVYQPDVFKRGLWDRIGK